MLFIKLLKYLKVLAAWALSSPSGEAAEDNIVEREKFWGGITVTVTVTDGQTDVEFEIVF